jgi:RNase adaptor protein for sRNA GlmZ degradation
VSKPRRDGARFIVLTGRSASQAIRAPRTWAFCVDNLPVALLPVMADLARAGREHERVAVVMDIREPVLRRRLPTLYRKLKVTDLRRS